MKFYFAGGEQCKVMKATIQKALFSYHSMSGKMPDGSDSISDIMVDSGAFSAWTQGITIDIDDYMAFLERNQRVQSYASLDVIGDAEASYGNYKLMKQAMFDPFPVFHIDEDFSWLETYCQSCDCIALGGMVGRHKRAIQVFLDTCFAIIKDYWPINIHGFGLGTSVQVLLRYPFYSTDSTFWVYTSKMRLMMDLDRLAGKVKFRNRNTKEKALFEATNPTPQDRYMRGIKMLLEIEEYVTSVWAKRGISWQKESR